jgi:AcrR family transcriptional regulator
VFLRHGFHGASLDEIAEEAGYTTGTEYSSFKGRTTCSWPTRWA